MSEPVFDGFGHGFVLIAYWVAFDLFDGCS
jgi:hypothetical protein